MEIKREIGLINKIKQNLENSKMFEEHFWRNVYKNIWRVLLLGEGLDEWRLPNPFAALDLVRVLKFLDYREYILQNIIFLIE